jgi:outer membrane protein assembly factor BamE (lipoprotein component of BamABCDE complex)
MRLKSFFLLVGLLLHSCVANDGLGSSSTAQINIDHLSRLCVGMNQAEVLNIMQQPYSQQTFDMDESVFDVWFYVTKPTVLGQTRMVPMNLTPLTFKNGELIGWGFSYYNYLVKRKKSANKALRGPTAPIEKLVQPKEDTELEKSLQKLVVPTEGTQPSQTDPPATNTASPSTKQKPAPKPKPPKQPPPNKSSSGNISMSEKPKKADMNNPEPPNPPPEKEKKKPLLNEKDRDMLEEESEQNFNQT